MSIIVLFCLKLCIIVWNCMKLLKVVHNCTILVEVAWSCAELWIIAWSWVKINSRISTIISVQNFSLNPNQRLKYIYENYSSQNHNFNWELLYESWLKLYQSCELLHESCMKVVWKLYYFGWSCSKVYLEYISMTISGIILRRTLKYNNSRP